MFVQAMKFGIDAVLRAPADEGGAPAGDGSALGGDEAAAGDDDKAADQAGDKDAAKGDDSALGGDDKSESDDKPKDDKSKDDKSEGDEEKSEDDDKSKDDKSKDDKSEGDDEGGDDDDKSKDSDADEDGETGAPEAYEDFALPEGRTVDTKVMDEFKAYAKGLDLSQKQAQGLVDMQVASAINNAKAAEDAAAEQKTARTAEWKDALAKDKDFGGDHLNKTLSHARQAMTALGGEPLRKAIVELGVGDAPELVKAFARLGAELADDTVSFGAGGFEKSRDQKLAGIYNNSNHNPTPEK